jgi:hypothetical protein
MVTVLEEYTAKGQCSVVLFFLVAKGLNSKDIHEEVFPVYGGKCLLCKAVHNWVDKFSQGCLKVTDDAQPGRPVEIATEATVWWVEELVHGDRKIMIDNVATMLGCSRGLAYSILHDFLEFWKVCA